MNTRRLPPAVRGWLLTFAAAGLILAGALGVAGILTLVWRVML